MKVCEAMTTTVQLCTPDDTLRNAAEAMAALGVGLLPVTDNEHLVGMISDRDIAIRGVGRVFTDALKEAATRSMGCGPKLDQFVQSPGGSNS
jgi:CBS domain-containing protein